MTRFHTRARVDGTVERFPYTPEEEAQRDTEEATWTAKQPMRETEQTRLEQAESRRKELAQKPTWTPLELEEAVRLALQ
jgi:hypothetical protein